VIASLVLLSTLLVAILTAHSRHAEQIRAARTRLDAIAAADSLLGEWNAQGQSGAPARAGRVASRPEWTWHWRVREAPELAPFGASVGRLEIVSQNGEKLTAIEVLTSGTIGPPSPAPLKYR
jgi:hypothetical protein